MSTCKVSSQYAENEEWYANDLRLAAELGKGLLDRNVELESNLKQQQTVIEEQTQKIQVLSRQSAALREVNESRLRVYEQLESSISDLEVTNDQLRAEVESDKKRIKSLCQNVEVLESKCLELQQMLDDLKASEKLKRKRDRNWTTPHSASGDASILKRRHSFQDGHGKDVEEDVDWAVRLRSSMSRLKSQLAKEEATSQELRAQVDILDKENAHLQEQQRHLEEQKEQMIFYHQAERLYWLCRHCRRSQAESEQADEESDDSLLTSSANAFSLMELEDGGSLPASSTDRNRINLLSELDAQYRAIIKKYEELVTESEGSPSDPSGQSKDLFRSLSQQSETSSGVSSCPEDEDDSSLEDRAVQTDAGEKVQMKSAPHYKQLFQEIFAVLKRTAPKPVALASVAETKQSGAVVQEKQSETVEPKSQIPKQRVYRQRVQGRQYYMPVPNLTGFPLFKLPGSQSYAQVVKLPRRRIVQPPFGC